MTVRRRSQRKGVSEINVVPYIDVMLVLLVIFLVTAPIMNQGVQVNLPQAQSHPLDSRNDIPMIVTVDSHGRFYFNKGLSPQQPLQEQDLVTQVAAQLQWQHEQGKNPTVLVKGDKSVSYGRVVSAMVLLQQAGVPGVGLMTSPENNHIG
ncbi:MAG: protein TolR [Gammaproteobacteria bacterium]